MYIKQGGMIKKPYLLILYNLIFYTMPCAIIAFATLRKPVTLAPRT